MIPQSLGINPSPRGRIPGVLVWWLVSTLTLPRPWSNILRCSILHVSEDENVDTFHEEKVSGLEEFRPLAVSTGVMYTTLFRTTVTRRLLYGEYHPQQGDEEKNARFY